MTTTAADIADLDLTADTFWELPLETRLAALAALRAEPGMRHFDEPDLAFLEPGPGYYAVTRHADVEHISSQPALFCSGQGAVSILDMPEDLVDFFGSLISMDDPRHAKIRRIVSRAFTPKMLEEVISSVEEIADEVLAKARATAQAGDGTFDLVSEIAAPLPLLVICRMMGIPEEDHEMVLRTSSLILSGGDPELMPTDGEPQTQEEAIGAFLEAGMELSGLMARLAEERQANPTDDLTSALANSSIDGESLTHQEIGSFFILLCVAGNETTRNAISHGVHALHEFPEQRERWLADPSLSQTAIEEIVRWATPVTWMRRTATTDVEIEGQQFKAGDKFLLFYNAANRDPAVFDQPDTFDIGRTPNPHLGFGARGPHFCLGSHLARRELAVAFRKLFEQMPDLEVVGEPDRLRSSFVNGIKRLPVRLTGQA